MAQMQFIEFNGDLNADGKALVTYLESQFVEADRTGNLEALNALPGMVKHYYTNVYKLRVMTSEQWIKDFPFSAQSAWENKTFTEKQAQQEQTVTETAAQTSELVKQLETLKAQFTTLSEQYAALEKQSSKKKPQTAPETEANTEADAESEA